MRTKEIDVWVSEGAFKNPKHKHETVSLHEVVGSVKAKLIITLPERKVEISESQFDEAWDKALELRGFCKAFLPELKKQLFKEQS